MSRMSNSDNYHQTGAHTVATARARREIGKWSIDQITAAVRYVVHKGTVWTGDLEMSVLKHLQDNAQSVRGHHPAGPNGYRHVLDARIWIRAPPAPQVPLSPETVVDHARIGELPERTARQQQHLEQHDPCADGPNNMVYRCQLCDEKDGPIAWDTIGHGNGICVDKKCYNYTNLIEWLHTQEDQDVNVMATIPHSRRELSSEELLSTPMSPAPPNGCTGGHIRESYIPPHFTN